MFTENVAIKHDDDKLPLHLLPFDALEAVTEILAFGAKKYTRKLTCSENETLEWLQKHLNAEFSPLVIRLKRLTATDSAEAAMKENSAKQTRNSQKDNEKIRDSGPQKTPSELSNTPNQGEPVRSRENVIPKMEKEHVWQETTEVSPVSISITVTKLDGYEEFCVVDAITVSECFARVLTCLKERYTTSKTLSEISFIETPNAIEIVIAGARNWEKGMAWHRLFRATMSHLWSWFLKRNDGKDPETGKSHLWHAGCCILFLIAYELRNVGEDTRP